MVFGTYGNIWLKFKATRWLLSILFFCHLIDLSDPAWRHIDMEAMLVDLNTSSNTKLYSYEDMRPSDEELWAEDLDASDRYWNELNTSLKKKILEFAEMIGLDTRKFDIKHSIDRYWLLEDMLRLIDDNSFTTDITYEIDNGVSSVNIINELRELASKASDLSICIKGMKFASAFILSHKSTFSDLYDAAGIDDLIKIPESEGEFISIDESWCKRIDALTRYANHRANQLASKVKSGGRITLGERIYKKPEIELALDCWDYVVSKGCCEESTVLLLWKILMNSWGPKDDYNQWNRGGKCNQKGRKWVAEAKEIRKGQMAKAGGDGTTNTADIKL